MREAPGDYYLFDIDVDEGQRGRGVGRLALEIVIRELKRSDVARLGLSVFDPNAVAARLYVSLGFETVSQPARDVAGALSPPSGEAMMPAVQRRSSAQVRR